MSLEFKLNKNYVKGYCAVKGSFVNLKLKLEHLLNFSLDENGYICIVAQILRDKNKEPILDQFGNPKYSIYERVDNYGTSKKLQKQIMEDKLKRMNIPKGRYNKIKKSLDYL